jgi:anti-sigma regulatory factor (Ser/Thr protein kinase)
MRGGDVDSQQVSVPWPVDVQGAWRRAELRLRGSPAPASAARDFSRRTLRSWGLTGSERAALASDIVLVVSELVTNAARHGEDVAWVALAAPGGGTIRVEVADLSTGLPTVRQPFAPARPEGHGLRLVQQAADRFGVDLLRNRPGKSVWAEFHRTAPQPPDQPY